MHSGERDPGSLEKSRPLGPAIPKPTTGPTPKDLEVGPGVFKDHATGNWYTKIPVPPA